MNKQTRKVIIAALQSKKPDQTDFEAVDTYMRAQGLRRAIWASYTSMEKIALVNKVRAGVGEGRDG